MKRILLLIPALVLTLSMVSCKTEPADSTESTAATQSTQHSKGEDETENPYDPELPAGLTFKTGNTPATFTVLTQDYTAAITDFVVEDNSTDQIDQLVLQRNQYVEELLGIEFNFRESAYDKTNDVIAQESMAGGSIDLVSARSSWGFVALTNGYLGDWNDINYVNIDKGWWMKKSIEELTIAGKSYFLQGDINASAITHQYCMYFNKTKGEIYLQDVNVFRLVSDYEWTFEQLNTIVKDIYESADETRDTNDFYGMVAQASHFTNAAQFAFDMKTVSKTEDGFPVLDVNIDKWSTVISTLYDFLNKTEGVYKDTGWADYSTMFASGQCIFVSGMFAHALMGRYKDMTDKYAIIPFPLYDETQETYYTMIDNASSSSYFMKNVKNRDMLGAVVEALGAYSSEWVTPEIYEVALKYRYADSVEQIEMIDFIHNGVSFDLGFLAQAGPRIDYVINSSKSNNYVSYHQSNSKAWETKLEDFIEFYLGIKKS